MVYIVAPHPAHTFQMAPMALVQTAVCVGSGASALVLGPVEIFHVDTQSAGW